MPVSSQTLMGEVEYTVDSARTAAFNNTDMTISMDEYREYQTDIFNLSHIHDIKNGVYTGGIGYNPHRVVPFYFKKILVYYGIQYEKIPDRKFYYYKNGKLFKVDICPKVETYPYKALSYDNKGRLCSVNLAISPNEAYVFDQNKKLIGHWKYNILYNPKGKVILTRKI